MLISKKKYQEKLDLIEGYKKKNSEKQEKIYDLQIEKSKLENQINILENNNIALLENNHKLIDWIEKIINELGCYEVSENNKIRIPVYKNERIMFGEEDYLKGMTKKEIVLPEVVYMQISWGG